MSGTVVSWIIAAFGAVVAFIGSLASLGNARAGRQNSLVQTAQFLQQEVIRLNNENKELRAEIEKLNAIVERRRTPRKDGEK